VPADGVELPRHDVELSIGIDDQRVLAAALGHERGTGLSAGGHHLLGGGGGADERNLVRARAARRGASVTKPVDELQHRLLRTTSVNRSTSHWLTPGVYSLGLRTMALPAASA